MDTDTLNDFPSSPAAPAVPTWVLVVCEKCGRRVQLEERPDDACFLEQIPYENESDSIDLDAGLSCPFCTLERGGTYWLVREGGRPPRDWELYVLDGTLLLGHVPNLGWFTFPNVSDGWAQRTSYDEAEALDEVAFLLADADDASDELPLQPSVVEGWPELGETGWPPFADAWRKYLEEEANDQMAWEAESADLRLQEPAWTGREEGWELRPGGLEGGVVYNWYAWTPQGRAWEFPNVPSGWEARMITTRSRDYCREEVDADAARGTGYPPAL